MFRPKDIVSGDFYWFSKVNEYQIYAVADSTGHGVPGAFMSMLGISFLNEIVRKKEVTQASHVLDQLRASVIDALRQTGGSGTQKDGMDLSLVVIKNQGASSKSQIPSPKLQEPNPKFQEEENKKNSIIGKKSEDNIQISSNFELQTLTLSEAEVSNFFHAQWAGANNPLWLIRSGKNLTGLEGENWQMKTPDSGSVGLGEDASANIQNPASNNKLFEFKPDKMPIAIYQRMESFTNHEFQLQSDDIIYLMTDGYEDQFGGSKGKKFLSKNLKQLLIDNCQMPMEEQKQNLEKTMVEWIGGGEQIDDITILGLKI